MSRLQILLIIVLLIEIGAGGWVLSNRATDWTPPRPDYIHTDKITAVDLRHLADNCESPEQWHELAGYYFATGFYPEAEACYRHAVGLNPTNAKWLYEWAFCLQALGKPKLANDGYKKALENGYDPPAHAWYFIGRNYCRDEKSNDANDALRRAGDLPAAKYQLARLHFRAGKVSAAKAIVDGLIERNPNALPLLLLRLNIAKTSGEDAIAANSRDAAAHSHRSLQTPFSLELQRINQAHYAIGLAAHWRRCSKLLADAKLLQASACLRTGLDAGWSPHAHDQLAEIELQMGHHDNALRLLGELVERDGPSVQTIRRLGDTHARIGQPELACKIWERVARTGSGRSMDQVHLLLAETYDKIGQKAKALEHRALWHHAKGKTAFRLGKLKIGQGEFEKSLELRENHADGWFYLGETLRLQGDSKNARAAYQRCLKINPDHGRTYEALQRL